MAMFNQWLRVNGDIETLDAGETGWGKAVADFTEDLAVRLARGLLGECPTLRVRR